MNLDKIIILARRNLGGNMESCARLCLSEAIEAQNRGDHSMAARKGLRSLAYSVGICHSSYARAFKASGIEGDIRLVS